MSKYDIYVAVKLSADVTDPLSIDEIKKRVLFIVEDALHNRTKCLKDHMIIPKGEQYDVQEIKVVSCIKVK